MELQCTFSSVTYDTGENYYSCEIKDVTIPEKTSLKFKGQHENGKSDNNVTLIYFSKCPMKSVPQGLTRIFPNLKNLDIKNSGLKKLTRNDLIEYKNLERFIFYGNELDFLPGNLFAGFENLESFSFAGNKLTFIEPNFLDGLKKLKHVNFKGNTSYNKCFSSVSKYSDSTLDEIKIYLYEKYAEKVKTELSKHIQDFSNEAKKVKSLEEKLKISEGKLKNCEEKLKESELSFYKEQFKAEKFKDEMEAATDNLKGYQMSFEASLEESNRRIEELTQSESRLIQQVYDLQKSNQNLEKELQKLRDSEKNLAEGLEGYKKSEMELTRQIQQFQICEERPSNPASFISNASFIQPSIYTDIAKFIQDNKSKDFKVKIEDREFPVHKFILAARSPTLAETISKNPFVDSMNFVDISVEIFEIILHFIYTDELPCDDCDINMKNLYIAAGRLKIDELKNFAAGKILNQINQENALEIFNMSNRFTHEELRQKAFNLVKQRFHKIVKFKDEWIDKPEKVAKMIEIYNLKMEKLKKDMEELLVNEGLDDYCVV